MRITLQKVVLTSLNNSSLLFPLEYISPDCVELVLHVNDATIPADRESLLLEDIDFSAEVLSQHNHTISPCSIAYYTAKNRLLAIFFLCIAK